MLTDDPINHFRELLEHRLAEANDALESARAADAGTVTLDQTRVGRLSRMDALQQQAMAQGLRERLSRNKRRLEAALDRLAGGKFGRCCQCGDPIALDRLESDPAVPFCSDCQAELEESRGC